MNTLYQDRETFKKDCKELQQTMGKELSEMKDYMGREGACFKVELKQRYRQIETLTTQMRCLSIPVNAPKAPHPHQHLHSQTPAAHLRHPPNHHTPATAKGKQKHLQPPETPQKNTTATTPAEKQPVKTEADIAILMDSNGKFLQEGKLFPGRKTTKLWCPQNTFWLQLWHTLTYHHTHRHQRPEKGTGESWAADLQSSREGYKDLPQHKDHHIYPPTPQRHSPRHHPGSQRWHLQRMCSPAQRVPGSSPLPHNQRPVRPCTHKEGQSQCVCKNTETHSMGQTNHIYSPENNTLANPQNTNPDTQQKRTVS